MDYWVARAEGYGPSDDEVFIHIDGRCRIAYHEGDDPDSLYEPSTKWSWGGPIIERERIGFAQVVSGFHAALGKWEAWTDAAIAQDDFSGSACGYGDTQLIAAMRAYVASKFGADVPDE